MNRLLTVTLGLLAVSAVPAAAADLPMKAPMAAPIMGPGFNWTGFYIGGNAGAAINDSRFNVDPGGCFLTGCGTGGIAGNVTRQSSGTFGNNTAFTGGGQVGYNWQFSPMWVFGLEADLNYNGTKSTVAGSLVQPPPTFAAGSMFNYSVSQTLDWFGTGRARLGWVPADRVMIYGTGGLAYGRVQSSTGVAFAISADTYAGSFSDIRVGWTAGGGIEWAFAQNWTAKAEYLYIDLGRTSYTDGCLTACGAAPLPSYTTGLTTREHIARFGINYLFNAGGPVVARY
jgi:outer membrane immunogenic protein